MESSTTTKTTTHHHHLSPTAEEYHPLPVQVQVPQVQPSYVLNAPSPSLPDTIPTRSLLVSHLPPHSTTEPLLRLSLEPFGGIRAIDPSRLLSEGIVVVHFFDVRTAKVALEAVRARHVEWQRRGGGGTAATAGVVLGWPHFCPEQDFNNNNNNNNNNGSLVVFNLDAGVGEGELRHLFERYGAVRDIRITPNKFGHKFVEFCDIRDAARALIGLNGKVFFGRKMSIQYSRPGGNGRSNYSRKSLAHHTQPLQLPPRLAALPRTSSGKSSSSSSTSPPSNQVNIGIATAGGGSSSSGTTCCGITSGAVFRSSKQPRQRNWKHVVGRNRAAADERFAIVGDVAIEGSTSGCRDSRTTVMIKNIPNKYSQKLLLNMLDNHCIECNEKIVAEGFADREPFSSYDFVYLPIDFNNKCNVGYGFVNMTSPEATWRLHKAFHSLRWELFNSRKICQITYARLQGLEALMDHFKNSKFACDNDEYMPVVFSPPRDGKSCTEPSTICRRTTDTIVPDLALLRLSSTASNEPTDVVGSSTPNSTLQPSEDEWGGGGGGDD